MRRVLYMVPLVLLVVPAAAAPAFAQEDPGAEPMRSVLEGVYTAAQADRGQAVFQDVCAACHGSIEFTMSYFMQSWDGARVYDLYRLISTAMPQDNPGSLEPQEYADVLAYIFELNAIPAGDRELLTDEDALKRIRIERKSTDDTGSPREGP